MKYLENCPETDDSLATCLNVDPDEAYTLFHISESREDPIKVNMKLLNTPLEMEVDTGASLSVIGSQTFNTSTKDLPEAPKLVKSNAVLRTYTGEKIPIKGISKITVEYNDKLYPEMPITVIEGNGPSLIGRNWLRDIKLKWEEICQLHDKGYNAIISKYPEVFSEGLGTLKGTFVKIHKKPVVEPKFHKARPVPYSMRDKVNQELERLQQQGIIEPVQFSEWAAPIVSVLKSDGTIRICGDYQLTVKGNGDHSEVRDKFCSNFQNMLIRSL